jgi:hypothetical protein
MILRDRLTATIDGDFAVFLIGVRINKPLHVRKWWSVITAMPAMLKELRLKPELGFLHAEQWFGRTFIIVQYWRSIEQLMNYATSKDSVHLPAWRAFNKTIGLDGSVGIWHETYKVSPGSYENVYVNMPAFGLGCAGKLKGAKDGLQSAAGRLHANAQ